MARGYFNPTIPLVPVFPANLGKIPKIVWDGNTLEFGMPLLEIQRYHEGDEANEAIDVQDGGRDGWKVGFNYFLAGIVPYIPRTDETTGYGVPVTGWEGLTGWRSFIIWAGSQRTFSFYPDRSAGGLYTCYLIEPHGNRPELTTFFARRPKLVLTTADRTPFLGY